MKAGQRDKRVILQTQSTTQDATGQMLNTWADTATVWASIRHVSGISAIKSDMDTSSVKASIRILRRAGVHAGMRVLHGTTVYDIQAVLPDEKNVSLDLVCQVVNAQT